jgi:Flp pilus assembly protein TadD
MISILKKFVLGCGVASVFFILVEVILMASGIEPMYDRTDPSVGFSGYAPLFTNQTKANGVQVYQTAHNKFRWFNLQTFPENKAKGTTRIFCVGGSTTYGRPYNDLTSFCGWLRQYLPAVDPSRHWEVINAGGISYASYRVARLMTEIAEYKPDLVIVYSGHNEFLESRTYNKLLKVPEFVRDLGALASHMRIYTLLSEIIYKPDADLSTEVNPLLDNSVGPEDYHRNDEMRNAILNEYEASLLRIADIGKNAGAKMILITPASNIRDFSPFKSESRSNLDEDDLKKVDLIKGIIKLAMDEEDYIRAFTVAKEALALDGRDADLLYLYAQALLALGRIDEARSAFTLARDEDICPLRALSPINKIVSNVSQIKNTGFVDFESMVNKLSTDGIPGSELFLDHVHPTIDGNRLLSLAIIEEMIQEGMVSPVETWNEAMISKISEKIVSGLDEKEHAVALRNLSKVLSWAGKEDEAERLVNLAADIIPDDSETHAQKGALLIQAGNKKAALKHYREAVSLNPWDAKLQHTYGVLLSMLDQKFEARKVLETAIRLDPNLENVNYDLGIVLQALGKIKLAESSFKSALKQNPNHPETYNNLGIILAHNGKLSAAYENFNMALKLNPGFKDAASNLEIVHKALGGKK